jgi:hypothetical protein
MNDPQRHAAAPFAALAPDAPVADPNSSSMAQPPKMDQAYIEHHQIAARYLIGQLPARYAFEFERFCRENPQYVDATGLPERINSGVRLLDIAGLRQPWDPEPPKFWQRLPVVLGVGGLTLLLAYTTYHFFSSATAAKTEIVSLKKRLAQDGATAITGTQLIMLEPSRTGKPAQAQFGVDLAQGPRLLELHINLGWSKANRFRVVFERAQEGRELIIGNLLKDSNGEVRMELNSSIFGSGAHTIQIEAQGLAAADHVPVAWSRFEVERPPR